MGLLCGGREVVLIHFVLIYIDDDVPFSQDVVSDQLDAHFALIFLIDDNFFLLFLLCWRVL